MEKAINENLPFALHYKKLQEKFISKDNVIPIMMNELKSDFLRKASDISKSKYISYLQQNSELCRPWFYNDVSVDPNMLKETTRLRLSSHNLAIEKGRHQSPIIPQELRLCRTCEIIENEHHFIFSCNKYISIRNSFRNFPSQDFSSFYSWKKCIHFVYKISKMHNNILE